MAKDPVCGMEVDERIARYETTYKGNTYYFCAAICKEKFEENPQKYRRVGSAGLAAGGRLIQPPLWIPLKHLDQAGDRLWCVKYMKMEKGSTSARSVT